MAVIAPKASAEGACILREMGFCYFYCYCYCYCSELETLFGSYSYDGLNAAIGVQHTEVPNLGASWSRFLAVTLMMV